MHHPAVSRLSLVALLASAHAAVAAPPNVCNPKSPCVGSTCPAAITASLAAVPTDACPRDGEFQSDVDVFGWNEFIALNWPADSRTCGPDTGRSILGPAQGPAVWETFPDDGEVFVPPGRQPAKWCTTQETLNARLGALAPALRAAATQAGVSKVLLSNSKASKLVLDRFPDIAQAVGGVLTAQNGRFVRYEKRLNRDEYDYLLANNLWNAPGQTGKTIAFPQKPLGAIEIKAAWKVLTTAEIQGKRFYMRWGVVFNDDSGAKSPGPNPVVLGLVGLHILHKTQSQSTWFWTTFEQVDNLTTSFFNPICPAPCPVNTQTAHQPYTELDPAGKPINRPVQVTRVNSIAQTDSASPILNAYYQGLLKGSVWANYQQVSTQWATGGAPTGTPPVLANTTLETYIQKSSSCLGCHKMATTAAGTSADFSFLLGEAQGPQK
jgi:hypothetical protein